jgi:four helix bundle protein
MAQFRFQELDIWKKSVDLGLQLFDLADSLEDRKKFRFAEQLRSAALSISNNIAEGSGSCSDRDFAHFVNIAKRSVFEVANMLLVFVRAGLFQADPLRALFNELETESRMMESFRKRLLGE